MNPKQYLKNLIPIIIINILALVSLALFLFACGNTKDTILYISILWSLVLVIYMTAAYYKRKTYLDYLLKTTEQLEEKYLIADLMEEPEKAEYQVFYQILKLSEKSMLENISLINQERKEYKEYILSWIHEVKTPITAMKLLCENSPGKLSKDMLAEIEKINRLAEQTLYYARSENTEKDYFIKETKLSHVIHGCIRENKYLLMQNGVSVHVDSTDDIVYTDAKWVSFILNQLIGNCIKYKSQNPHLHFFTQKLGEEIQLFIKDNGIGISKSDLDHVFEKGFTGKNGRTHDSSTGLGLYLTKRLCDKLGIKVQIDSNENGTTLIMSFYINHFVVKV